MDAKEVLERLVSVGDELTQMSDEAEDLVALAKARADEATSRLDRLVDDVDEEDVQALVDRLGRARDEVLDGRELAELSDEELVTYSRLGSLRGVLSARKVRMAADEDFLAWFAEEAWPVIKTAAPVVLALL